MSECSERISSFRFLFVFYVASNVAQTNTTASLEDRKSIIESHGMDRIYVIFALCNIMDHFTQNPDFTWLIF